MIPSSLAHYQILGKIGAGGMGEVYRARDTRLGREVALKILPAEAAGDPERRRRFEREARAVAALQHPNIVTIFSIEEAADVHFLTMELVDGQTLAHTVAAGPLDLDAFLALAIALADAVGSAHTHGITHRDLKPTNIMIDGQGRAKILDFGLAKLGPATAADTDVTIQADPQLTNAGQVLGTAAYMSPEQVRGGEIGGWSDVFALGIIFHELLSGSRPFGGAYPAEIMHNIAVGTAPPLASVPEGLGLVIERCLRKPPGERFADGHELRDALRDLATAAAPAPAAAPPSAAAAAFARGDWEGAYGGIKALAAQRELSADELAMLGTAAGWLGEFDEGAQAWERAHAAYARQGRNIDAARMALELVGLYLVKNASAVAGGWQKRAERLLQDHHECLEYGLLLRRQTMDALGKGDTATALALNRECSGIADRFADADLQAVALHDRGQILIADGEVEAGQACVDEAMAAAVSGGVDPATLGNLYCRTMTVCRSLADFKRVRQWSEAAWRWCQPFTASGYPGVCRIHSAETMRHLGLWQEAEQASRDACRYFEKCRLEGHAGEAYNELGELTLRKGELQAAEDAFRRAHELGCDPVPGLPLLRLAQGNREAALQIIERALGERPADQLRRAKLLPAMTTIALANGDLARAEAASAELGAIAAEFGCPCFQANALMGQGGLELARGNPQGAAPLLAEAWSVFSGIGYPYDAARARVLLATAYIGTGNDEDAKLQLGAACRTFGELGAQPDRDAAAALMGR